MIRPLQTLPQTPKSRFINWIQNIPQFSCCWCSGQDYVTDVHFFCLPSSSVRLPFFVSILFIFFPVSSQTSRKLTSLHCLLKLRRYLPFLLLVLSFLNFHHLLFPCHLRILSFFPPSLFSHFPPLFPLSVLSLPFSSHLPFLPIPSLTSTSLPAALILAPWHTTTPTSKNTNLVHRNSGA